MYYRYIIFDFGEDIGVDLSRKELFALKVHILGGDIVKYDNMINPMLQGWWKEFNSYFQQRINFVGSNQYYCLQKHHIVVRFEDCIEIKDSHFWLKYGTENVTYIKAEIEDTKPKEILFNYELSNKARSLAYTDYNKFFIFPYAFESHASSISIIDELEQSYNNNQKYWTL